MVITNVAFLQHGEPGGLVTDIQPSETVVSHLLNQILSKVWHNIVWKALGRSILTIGVLETWCNCNLIK